MPRTIRDRLTAIIAIVLLAGLAATSYWYSRVTARSGLRNPATPNAPDFVVDKVVLTQFDQQGHARNRLFADRMRHYVEDDRIEVDAPRLVSLQPDEPQVEVRARRGRVEGSGERIHLLDDVVITRAAGPKDAPMKLETQSLLVLPDYERYSTQDPVRMERGGSVATANAMELDNLARTVKLKGQVKTIVEPAPDSGPR
jgi:lipopolysaccharide export system protein LptC